MLLLLERKYCGSFRLTLLPQPLVSSVFILSVDFSGPEAQVSIRVSHYGILEGLQLVKYLVAQSLVIFNVLIIFLDVANSVRTIVRSGEYDVTKLIEPFVDFICAALVILYVTLMFRSVPGSAESAAHVLKGLEGIPWSNPDVQLQVKSCVRYAHDSAKLLLLIISRRPHMHQDQILETI